MTNPEPTLARQRAAVRALERQIAAEPDRRRRERLEESLKNRLVHLHLLENRYRPIEPGRTMQTELVL